MAKSNINSKQGFTIIEVVLVLAIAGLIFLMVFIALPALQRSQRDTQRRDDLARVSTAITQYQTNNNGKVPMATGYSANTFIANYLGGSEEFKDPDGEAYEIEFGTTGTSAYADPTTFTHTIYVFNKAACSGEQMYKSDNTNDYAIVYKLEGSGTYCADNGGNPTSSAVTSGS